MQTFSEHRKIFGIVIIQLADTIVQTTMIEYTENKQSVLPILLLQKCIMNNIITVIMTVTSSNKSK